MTTEEAAIKYAQKGFSVIVVGRDKKPLLSWAEYQNRRATEDEIRAWFRTWPNANIAIVTGKISGNTVVDLDSQPAIDYFLSNYKGTTPCCDSPRGMHGHFQYEQGTRNTVKVNGLDIDVRSDGGYVIVPPSINDEGKPYKWITSLLDVPLAPLPDFLKESIFKGGSNNNSFSLYTRAREGIVRNDEDLTKPYNSLHFLTHGTRDNDLFHVGNCLIKGGCEPDVALQVLEILAQNCNPPFSEKEVLVKIKSVLSRCERRERNLTEDLRKWIDLTSAYFSLTETYDPLQILTSQKNTVHQIMHRFVKDGYVERHPNKNGVYRRVDQTIEFMDFANADPNDIVTIKLPLGIHLKTKFFPKSAIVLGGVSGMGKTLFVLNAINDNMDKMPCFYFNSEMSPQQLKSKLSYFQTPFETFVQKMKVVDDWDFRNIADKIQPNAFNCIDYLEPEADRPYSIHEVISAIIRKLDRGIALIAVQKRPGAKFGTGGIYSVKASSLALSLEFGKIEIVKNRNREADKSPLANCINFDVVEGHRFVNKGYWYEEKEQKRYGE